MSLAYLSRRAVAEQRARSRSGAVAILEGFCAVHQDVLVPIGLLHPPPLIGRQVVEDLAGPGLDGVRIVNHDVRGHPLPQGPTILEAGRPSPQAAQPEMGLFE